MNEATTELTLQVKRFSVSFTYKDLWGHLHDVHKIVEASSQEEALGKIMIEHMKSIGGSDPAHLVGRKFYFGGAYDHVIFEV